MNLSAIQAFLFLCDILMEAIWPLSLIVTVDPKTHKYPYDPFVMQAWSGFVAFFISYLIDYYNQNCVRPSFRIGAKRWRAAVISAFVLCIANLLLVVGFRMSSSGAAATIGFLSLPMYILVEFLIAITWFNLEDLHAIRKKLHSVSPELLLIITTCAYLFVLEDQGSQNYGIAFLLLGRLCLCIKSYLNERSALLQENESEGTISSATLFLLINTIMMYMSSPPMALLEYGEFEWINLISLKGWEWLTILPFCAEFGIHITNILCETWIGGEMHTIAGMFGRILGMYIAFTYDVKPTHPIVLAVFCITLAVVAYIRLHYRVVATEKSVDLIDGHQPFLTTSYWNGKINFVNSVATC